MSDDFPVQVGDTATVAMLSLCAGGLVRTWTDTGPSRLWSVTEPQRLLALQGTGTIARTLREEGRFREVGWLSEDSGTLMLPSRFPQQSTDERFEAGADLVSLGPATEPAESWPDDVRLLLAQAIRHCIASNEFLLVEVGGWDAPTEPYCLFMLTSEDDGVLSVIEAAPPPHGSEIWDPHIVGGQQGATLSAPANEDTIDVAPLIMIEAVATWGVSPWDLALTFGRR
ncbi:hypothetical protein AU193_09745 [Mycobacterium sp. GA-1285]|uniref:hypothetical protein n=1 Tax=Mycobacterium sp. GA-1285 TaxID=1772282 RepID=UPI000746A31D|nr:hypothetical protein [Mycobacterium sp. GA-1285]KUI22900.1 hypothetical protein AU193_09745 [Mycobacterium sp. GA-1285]